VKGVINRLLVVAIVLLPLVACSTMPPLDMRGVDTRTTTRQAVATSDALRGSKIIWGGVIVQSGNRPDSTQLEVLAYPLRYNNRPDINTAPLGRFIIVQQGYLETVDYAPGRAMTVVGTLAGVRHGKVGEAEYDYPVVLAQQLRLWPAEYGTVTEPQFHIGVGVFLH
jgi:outer membrane lipoprotein